MAAAPAANESTDGAALARDWRKLLSSRWLLAIVVISLLGHGAALALVSTRTAPGVTPVSPEVALGRFQFVATRPSAGGLCEATFQLHGVLAHPRDRALRGHLDEHQFLVQQAIEELLRRCHAQDFADPSLAELKRQLLETINQSLESRVLSGVIVTQLALKHAPADGLPPTPAAATGSTQANPAEAPSTPPPQEAAI